ncbi:unnamed protein product [Notodromas monacha]|uniref:Anti-proliferative protein domain-containing protein n=1 Tax=Notodromas monacha TaxID=399045 RepID=A0A7R9BIP2_9CRUS|nr:unnamed protein product [Notodromas monacha]CAG0915123.1 unnamed protein product [Notodromas monacha]
MHMEIQVALNFVISYLYNKLPRRRVNIFGEELEKALKAKFDGHWYPEKPCRGSAFRCLKTSNPVDPVLCIAALESGMVLDDIREHLPQDMSVWIDPGEVSFRIGEKGPLKMLYSEKGRQGGGGGGVACGVVPAGVAAAVSAGVPGGAGAVNGGAMAVVLDDGAVAVVPNSEMDKPVADLATAMTTLRVASPTAVNKQPVTFTTAAFAQTKFGSTKLKNSSKRPNRMSPTEFSHYIKQRALLQQQQRLKFAAPVVQPAQRANGYSGFPRPRSLSPGSAGYELPSPLSYLSEMKAPVAQGISPFPDTTGLWQPPSASDLLGGLQQQQQSFGGGTPSLTPPPSSGSSTSSLMMGQSPAQLGDPQDLMDGLNLGALAYTNASNGYQHLLVAN